MNRITNHDCKGELNELHLRATPARLAVMNLLEQTKEPLDVGSVIEHLTKQEIPTDPATAFRIMNMFTQKGITRQVQFHEGKLRYELAGKPDHHHLICDTCGRIEDIEDPQIPEFEKHIQKEHKFLVKRHALEFFGLCQNCQK